MNKAGPITMFIISAGLIVTCLVAPMYNSYACKIYDNLMWVKDGDKYNFRGEAVCKPEMYFSDDYDQNVSVNLIFNLDNSSQTTDWVKSRNKFNVYSTTSPMNCLTQLGNCDYIDLYRIRRYRSMMAVYIITGMSIVLTICITAGYFGQRVKTNRHEIGVL